MNQKMVEALGKLSEKFDCINSVREKVYEGFLIIDDEIKMFYHWECYGSQDFYFVSAGIETEVYKNNRLTGEFSFVGKATDEIYDYDNEYDRDYLYRMGDKKNWKNYTIVTHDTFDSDIYFMEVKDCKTVKEFQL